MEEQNLMEQPRHGLRNIFKIIYHHFMCGGLPYSISPSQYSLPFVFSFDSHPGPIKDAISDAINLHLSLFLFIYSEDNPDTKKVVSLLQKDSIIAEMNSHFIFLPLDVSHPEGWGVACKLSFTEIPLIAIIRPAGESLEESCIFMKYNGKVEEEELLSSMRIEHNERNNNADAEVVQEQNMEFIQAVNEENENERRQAQEEEERKKAEEEQQSIKERIDKEFEEIPVVKENEDSVTIKFQFPDNTNRIRKFTKDSPVRLIFVFVRKYIYPKQFKLMTGFPQYALVESDNLIKDVFHEKNFIIHVEENDE